VLAMTTFINCVPVLGPSSLPPTPDVIRDVLLYGRVHGAILVPALIDALCANEAHVKLLCSLRYIHYVGAPLGIRSGELLTPHVRVVPSIGSTECGGYFMELHDNSSDWDYVGFQPSFGASFEPRLDNMHELVFQREPGLVMQTIFLTYPDLTRFETKDLWIEHPTRKGLWKIVGRTDDYVFLANGDGLYVATLEPQIEAHPLVRSALVGGYARPKPMVLIDLVSDSQAKDSAEFRASLRPYLDKVNEKCHESVKLAPELVLVATKEKPFARTIKGTVARAQTMKLYEAEIDALYRKAGYVSG